MMTFVPRNLTSIAQLPKFIRREWSFGRLAVSRSFGFLLPRVSYCSLSISLYTESKCIVTLSTWWRNEYSEDTDGNISCCRAGETSPSDNEPK